MSGSSYNSCLFFPVQGASALQARVIDLHQVGSRPLLYLYQTHWHLFHAGCIVSPWHQFLSPPGGCRAPVTHLTPSSVDVFPLHEPPNLIPALCGMPMLILIPYCGRVKILRCADLWDKGCSQACVTNAFSKIILLLRDASISSFSGMHQFEGLSTCTWQCQYQHQLVNTWPLQREIMCSQCRL